jgi:cell division cycle 14
MTERELADAIEIIPDRLYWVALHARPKNTLKSHYFSIDNELVYEPFFADFGPLNLSLVYRYCTYLEAKLKDPSLADKRIIHYCSHDSKKRANAAFLICAYQVSVQNISADVAFDPFFGIYPQFLPFRDATCRASSFHLTILDCLKGLEYGIRLRWYDRHRFDVESYQFFEKVDNGDMNWVVPDKFLAFAGPCPTSTDGDGYPAFTPEDYVPIFREAGIGLVVRLNKEQYDRRRFINHGIKHVDLYFLDGSCPSREIITKFLHIVENEPGSIAVHCKAGLGRTGTLIGLYSMKHFQFPARAFIGWNRICRPGSILGPQQQFMVDMESEMHQAGIALRRPVAGLITDAERQLASQVERLSVRGLSQQEQAEDLGQGDRLVGAKRVVRSPGAGSSSAGSRTGSSDENVLPPVNGGFGAARERQSGVGSHRQSTDSNGTRAKHESSKQMSSMLRRSLRGMFSGKS